MSTADSVVGVPSDPSHRWEWIKFQLRIKGTSLAKIARALKVSGPAVKNAKNLPYPRVERAIAAELGLKPIDIWPERWAIDGNPSRRRPNAAERRRASSLEDNAAYDLGHRKYALEG